MRMSLGLGLTAAAVIGTALTPAAGWAAVTNATAQTPASAGAAAGGDPNTTITFAVTTGELSMTAPAAIDLGSGPPGATLAGPTGTNPVPDVVTDTRALLDASWTVTASSTDFTTGGDTSAETIPAGDATYTPGAITVTGSITATATPITLSNGAQPVVGATGSGNNTATWTPAIAVAVPATAVGGDYTGTLTQSVA
jgi:hypothetical protein